MGYTLNDICFSYENRVIFSGINLEMETGGFHGVLGANGSGKTTLLDLITGHLKPENGDILLDGRPLDDLKAGELAKKMCAGAPGFPGELFFYRGTGGDDGTLSPSGPVQCAGCKGLGTGGPGHGCHEDQ